MAATNGNQKVERIIPNLLFKENQTSIIVSCLVKLSFVIM